MTGMIVFDVVFFPLDDTFHKKEEDNRLATKYNIYRKKMSINLNLII